MDGVSSRFCLECTRRVAATALLTPALLAAQAADPLHAEMKPMAADMQDSDVVTSADMKHGTLHLSGGFEARRDPVLDRQTLTALGATQLAGRAEMASIGYRWWASNGRVALGLGVGSVTRSVVAPAVGGEPERLAGQTGGPAVTVGWRLRLSDQSTLYADTSALRGLGPDSAAALYTTKGGIEWKTSKSRLGFERGSVAMQLDSGYRLSLRTRGGGVAIVLRGSF
ncbi:hypothetical protein [Methylibium sp.]|uniref:hypothetical protein n=1 Tax=Methylibium sp. TaxID=2067992 RepID=UPI003D11C684